MSEFKFACPVCGQHITADVNSSGQSISCPTCFRQMVVPQAPLSRDSKLVVTASELNRVQTSRAEAVSQLSRRAHRRSGPMLRGTIAAALIVVSATATWWFWRRNAENQPRPETAQTHPAPPPVQTNGSLWTLDLSTAEVADGPAKGKVHGHRFTCEQATFQGGALTLTHGTNEQFDSKVVIQLFARHARHLSEKSFAVPAEGSSPRPPVVLSWKNGPLPVESETIQSGYVLKLSFGKLANGRLPGEIYLGLPDERKSYVTGGFDAEVLKEGTVKPVKSVGTN